MGERGRVPALDALRGVAVLLVVSDHAGLPITHGGAVGVSLFFVLSGYLITKILLDRPGLWRFYARRAARLLPALFLMVGSLGLLALVLDAHYWTRAWPALAYFANWWQLAGHPMGVFSHTWSLAIEEQFYVVWPLVLLAPRRLLPGIVAVVIIASLGLRLWFAVDGQYWRAYDGTDTNAYALAMGAFLACTMTRAGPRLAVPFGAFLVAVAVYLPGLVAAPLTAVVGGALLIWGAQHAPAPAVLRHAGTVSYSWYLWHYPLIGLTVGLAQPPVAGGCIAALAALGIAALSTKYVEIPARALVRVRTSGDKPAATVSGHPES